MSISKYQGTSAQQWTELIKNNTLPKLIMACGTRKKLGLEYDFIDNVILFFKIILWLIALGIAIPVALWVARKIIRSSRRTAEEVKKKK